MGSGILTLYVDTRSGVWYYTLPGLYCALILRICEKPRALPAETKSKTKYIGHLCKPPEYTVHDIKQCFGSGSKQDPYSVRSVDPDPDPGGQK
jgi:hypothetical protein